MRAVDAVGDPPATVVVVTRGVRCGRRPRKAGAVTSTAAPTDPDRSAGRSDTTRTYCPSTADRAGRMVRVDMDGGESHVGDTDSSEDDDVTELDASRTRIGSVLDDAVGDVSRETTASTPRSLARRPRPYRSATSARSSVAAAGAPPGDHRRQPEGRRRQDHERGEPRRRAGPARAARAGDRPRPAGQRHHRRWTSSTTRAPRRLRLLVDERAAGRGRAGRSGMRRTSGASRPPSTWPAPRSSWSRMVARESRLQPGASQAYDERRSTTSSSTARRRSAC